MTVWLSVVPPPQAALRERPDSQHDGFTSFHNGSDNLAVRMANHHDRLAFAPLTGAQQLLFGRVSM